jgi:hypothetical protein
LGRPRLFCPRRLLVSSSLCRVGMGGCLLKGFLDTSQPEVDTLSFDMFSSLLCAGSHCILVLMEYDTLAAFTISCGLESIRLLYASVVAICQIGGVRCNLWECGVGSCEEPTLRVSWSIPISQSLCRSPYSGARLCHDSRTLCIVRCPID